MTPEQIERLKSLTEWIGLSSDSQNAIRALLAEWEERGSALDRAAIARGEAEAEIERLRERVSWFERGGGVDKTTAFFREQIRAEQAEARLAQAMKILRWRALEAKIAEADAALAAAKGE